MLHFMNISFSHLSDICRQMKWYTTKITRELSLRLARVSHCLKLAWSCGVESVDMAMQNIFNKAKSEGLKIAEYFTPTLKDSKFAETGVVR